MTLDTLPVASNFVTLALLALALPAWSASVSPPADRSVTEAPFHARADMKALSDAAIQSGSQRLSSASASLAPNDVGKAILIAGAGAGGGALSTTIAAVQDRGHATLRATASATVIHAQAAYGTDDTAAFQAALDAQGRAGGGAVSLPAGAYLVLGTLAVPKFVRLHGALLLPSHLWGALPGHQFPGDGPLDGGTTLGMVEGFGHADAPPFLTVGTNAVVEGVAIDCPLQGNDETLRAPTPAPWAISLTGNADRVSNINLVNVYQGIRAWSGDRHWIDHITGQPTFKGISIDNGGDVDRVEAIHFVPQFNNNTTLLPGAVSTPGLWQWQQQHGTAFEIGRDDQFRLLDCFCLGYWRGFHFAVNPSAGPNKGNRPYGRLIGCGADLTAQPCFVDDTDILGITFTDCDFAGLDDSVGNHLVYTAPTFTGRLSFVNCNFWNAFGAAVVINAAPYGPPNVSSPEATFTSCQFQTWDIQENRDACIQANGGDVRVLGCDFRLDGRPDFYASPATRQFLATGNFCAGGVSLQSGSKAITQADNLSL